MRGLTVLSALATLPDGATLNELSEHLDLPRASLHRLLAMLQQSGYLINQSGTYTLGQETFRLARQVELVGQSTVMSRIARPVVEWLAGRTGETVVLGTVSKDRGHIVYSEVINAQEPLRCEVPEGDRTPLYSSASGQAVLAFLPHDECRNYIAKTEFQKFTEFTAGKDELLKRLPGIRRVGIVKDHGHMLGAIAIACPIFDSSRNALGAIAVLGPEARIEKADEQISGHVMEAARRVSRSVGYSGTYPPPDEE